MSFLDTEPAAIHRLDSAGHWSRFRVTDPRQRSATLRELCRGDVPLTLGSPGGPSFAALLWSVDERTEVLNFSAVAEVDSQRLATIAVTPGLWAAGYLHEAKVQFDVRGLNLGSPGPPRMLHAALPRHMVHLPRRRALRVRRAEAQAPTVRFQHPLAQDVQQRLRVADISMTGCALWKPADHLPLAPGADIRRVEVELDDEAIFFADLHVQHVTLSARGMAGLRVGCDWRGLSSPAADTLQAWIARGRRRRDLVSLSLD